MDLLSIVPEALSFRESAKSNWESHSQFIINLFDWLF